MLMQQVEKQAPALGVGLCCWALGIWRASYYRWLRPQHGPHQRRRVPHELSDAERQAVLDALHAERLVDQAPAQVVATLLDEQQYLCSERTTELLATTPNQLWSWDISAPQQAA